MSPFTLRTTASALLFIFGISLCAQVASTPAVVPPGKSAEKDKKSASVEVMTFPSDRDAKNMIQAVKDYMKEFEKNDAKAPWDRICKAAQTVLNAKSDSFFELPKPSPDAPQARVSAKAEINRLIGDFPKTGREFYQLTYGAEAEKLLSMAKDNYYDRVILADVSQRFFHTKSGAEATLLLAAVQLERGNFAEAAYSYERMMTRPDSEEYWTPLTVYRALASIRRAGTAPNSPTLAKLNEMLAKSFPRSGLTIGRRNYSMDELQADLDKPFESVFNRVAEQYIAMRFGNASHTAIGEGGKPFLDPTWSHSLFINMGAKHRMQEGNVWVKQNLEDVLRSMSVSKGDVVLPGFFPATAKNLVFFRSYDGIFAFITKDGFNNHGKPARVGDLYWYAPLKGAAASLVVNSRLESDGYRRDEVENYWRFYRDQPAYKSILFENPLTGSLSHDGKAVYAVDETALPPIPQLNQNEFGMMPINPGSGAAPAGKPGLQNCNYLKSMSIETGNMLWSLGASYTEKPLTPEEEEKTTNTLFLLQNSFFLGPPLPVNGKLYVLYERNGAINVACLDPNVMLVHKAKAANPDNNPKLEGKFFDVSYPSLVWNQRLGEPNSRLPQDTARRFQCSYLAYSDGVLICPTNAGAMVAVDVMSRSLLWARSYRTLKTTDTRAGNPGGRRINPGGMPAAGGQSVLNSNRWRAAAPIVSQGRIVFAAFDSDDLFCIDIRTGDVIWKEPRKPNDLYLGGLMNDKVLVISKDSIRAINLHGKPKDDAKDAREEVVYAWKDVKIGSPAGHGATSKDGIYYIPLASSPDESLPQVWALDVNKGEIVAKAAFRKKDLSEGRPMLGNLAFHEGQLLSQSPLEIAAFPLIELKKQEMNRLLAANPNDPDGLVARGEMSLDEGKLSDAIADFHTAAKHNPSESARMRLRDKLFLAYTELFRRDFNAAEKHLDEYKALCIVVTDAEDPNIKLRQKDENDRRQRLYLELIAKGREAQGKLIEAFDHYRAFASYGGNKELVTVSDEMNGKTRPDVWARGRIEMMIRTAKDETAKKSLRDLVDREWDAVKDGTNPAKLRDFVNIFGSHFKVGRDAELLLGEILMASPRDEDHREAQAVLTRLSATAEEDTLAARALETLAKYAARKGHGETAIGFYLTLGTKYAATKVRDGVTGADLLNELLTDKRLLPYLEPARIPTPARVKATREGSSGNYIMSGYVLEPDGAENEPFYRRHRILLSNDNGGTWMMRILDRASGEEKWKVGGLQMYNPTGAVNYRIAQARGSLLLLHMGVNIYCFDLAEKKKCWEYPVFGEGSKIDFNNARFDAGSDEELVITYNTDGSKFTVGRSSILEANYAAIVTRDGLVAIDPLSGSKLWTRTNIPASSLIFGDTKHIFVVETVAGKSTSRVLRALDGSPIDGVPEFASLVSKPGRRVIGRNLLLNEGGRLKPLSIRLYDPLVGKDIWKKDYAAMPEPDDYKSRGLEFNGQAKLIKTFTNDLTGAFQRDGKFELLDVNTGKVVFKSAIDAENADLHAGSTGLPVLLADSERYYLVLNKNADNNRNLYMHSQMRMLSVNGPLYCYEKATGKRAWFVDKLFENQQLIVERFNEMPALVTATHVNEDFENGVPIVGKRASGGTLVYRVAVVDKVNGRLRYLQNLSQNGSAFYSIDTQPRLSTARLTRGDMTLVISPDDGTGSQAASAASGKPQRGNSIRAELILPPIAPGP